MKAILRISRYFVVLAVVALGAFTILRLIRSWQAARRD